MKTNKKENRKDKIKVALDTEKDKAALETITAPDFQFNWFEKQGGPPYGVWYITTDSDAINHLQNSRGKGIRLKLFRLAYKYLQADTSDEIRANDFRVAACLFALCKNNHPLAHVVIKLMDKYQYKAGFQSTIIARYFLGNPWEFYDILMA